MPTYSYTTLNAPGNPLPIGINDAGQIVGVLENFEHSSSPQSFLYSGGSYTTLPDDPFATSGTTVATGINNAGQIVGYYRNAGNPGFGLGFLYSNGTFTTIDDPLSDLNHANGSGTAAYSINNAGQVVGGYSDGNLQTHGFLYSNSIYTTIDDPLGVHGTSLSGINDNGQIVGTYTDSNFKSHSFLYSNGTFTTIDDDPLATYGTTEARGINNAGQIVGSYIDENQVNHGFLYSGGNYTTIDDPLASHNLYRGGVATGINNAGQIVGSYQDDHASGHGFLATPSSEQPPIISSVSAAPSDGDLGPGNTITLTVNFSEAVTIAGGTPTLALNDGGTATYQSGSGSSGLVFTYTVGAPGSGQNTSDLALATTSAINLNGATITDAFGTAADLSGADGYNPVGTLQIDTTVKPDLTASLESIGAPMLVTPGQNVTVNYTIHNIQSASAPSSLAKIVMSPDAMITGTGNDIALSLDSIGALAGNASEQHSTSITLPSSLSSGGWYFAVIADAPDGNGNTRVDEAEENNNISNLIAVPITILGDEVHQGIGTTTSLEVSGTVEGVINAEPISSDISISLPDGTGGYVDKDWYQVTLNKGTIYTFSGRATSMTTGLIDISLYGHNGTQIHAPVEGANPSFTFDTTYQSSATQTYYLAVSAGGPNPAWKIATGDYVVSLSGQTSSAAADQIPGSIQSTTPLPLGPTYGAIDPTDINGGPDDDYYRVTLTGGDKYTFIASAGVSNSDTLDSVFIRLRDANGNILTTGDKTSSGPTSSFDYSVPGSGSQTYYLAISASSVGSSNDVPIGQKTGQYSITLVDDGPTNSTAASGPIVAGFEPATTGNYPEHGIATFDWLMANTNLRWVGYYLGAPNRTDTSWMGHQAELVDHGWTVAPLYVGEQDPVATADNPYVHSRNPSAEKGVTDGLQAVSEMSSEGFTLGSVVYLDLEAPGLAGQPAMQSYVQNWCSTVSNNGYTPGVYCIGADAAEVTSLWPDARLWVADYDPKIYSQYFASPGTSFFPTWDISGSGHSDATAWQYEKGYIIATPYGPYSIDLDVMHITPAATISVDTPQDTPTVGNGGLLAVQGSASSSGTNLVVGAQGTNGVISNGLTGDVQIIFSQFSEFFFNGGQFKDEVKLLPLSAAGIADQTVYFNGNDGNDTLDGSAADTSIVASGGNGNDTLLGGPVDDVLNGGPGNDMMTGGPGADLFVFARGDGADVITDFNCSEGDRIDLRSLPAYSGADFQARQVGNDTVLDFGNGDSVTIKDQPDFWKLVILDNVNISGHPDQQSQIFLYATDTTAPVLTAVTDQTEEATGPNGAAASFAATATDLVDGTDQVVFTEGNEVVHSGDTFNIGTHTITASASDAAGNMASETFTIKVQDTTPPDTSIVTKPSALTNSNNAAFIVSGNDAVGVVGFRYEIDNGANWTSTTSTTISFAGLTDGNHTFQVAAFDASGNVDATPASYTWTVDTTPPALTAVLESPSTGDLGVGQSGTIALTTSEAVTVTGTPTLSLNDGGTATYDAARSTSTSLVFDYTVAAGQNTSSLAAIAVNLAGGATIADGASNNANLSLAGLTQTGPKIGTVTNVHWIDGIGNWTKASDWSGGAVPGPSNNVTIAQGYPQVTANVGTVNSITNKSLLSIEKGGALATVGNFDNRFALAVGLYGYGGGSLSVGGALTNGGAISVGSNARSEIQAASLDNSGLISVSGASASAISTLDVTGATENNGSILSVAYGNVIIGGAVTGSGSFTIGNKSTLELGGADAEAVNFLRGAAGTLVLDQSTNFTGHVRGLTPTDTLDLKDIIFNSSRTTVGYSGNSTGGTLTVSDGAHTASIALLGQYMAASFVSSADGFGGTVIHELPPASLTQILAHPEHA